MDGVHNGLSRHYSWKIPVCAVAYAAISFVIHNASAMLSLSYYKDQQYLALWSKVMMPAGGMPGLKFYALSIFFAFVTGIIFAGTYTWFRGRMWGKTVLTRGLFFGKILFLVSAVPGYLATGLLLAVPTALLLIWAAESLVIMLLGAMFIAWMIK